MGLGGAKSGARGTNGGLPGALGRAGASRGLWGVRACFWGCRIRGPAGGCVNVQYSKVRKEIVGRAQRGREGGKAGV